MEDETDVIENAGPFVQITTVDETTASWIQNGGDSYRPVGRRRNAAQYATQLGEALRLIERFEAGDRRAALDLQEALTTSDFTTLFSDILDREMLGRYAEWPIAWSRIFRRGVVPDFRTVSRHTLDGAESALGSNAEDKVPETGNYRFVTVTDGRYQYTVAKYGRKFALTWEAIVNDDLDAFGSLPARMARAARRGEDYLAASLLTDASGPDGTFYSAPNGNLITGNPVLSVASLEAGVTLMSQQTDPDGEPIFVEGMILAVPPALVVTANNIVQATSIRSTAGGGATGREIEHANWLAGNLEVVAFPYLGTIPTTNGATSWYLFADPNTSRPAGEIGFLRGHEQPRLFVKSNTQNALGGGSEPMLGDFENDSIEWKQRHVMGGTLMDPIASVASDGSGS